MVKKTKSLKKQSSSKVKEKNYYKIGFFILLAVFLIILGFLVGQYIKLPTNQLAKNKKSLSSSLTSPSKKQNQLTVSSTPSMVSPTKSVKKELNKIFYIKDNNIFSYDSKMKTTTNETDFPKNKNTSPVYDSDGKELPSINIINIKVIDNKTIGFGKCATITGDFGCGLYILDLETKQITEKTKLDKDEYLISSDWASPNKFAYIVSIGHKWQFLLSENKSVRILEDLKNDAGGRGGSEADSQKISFSPDKTHIFEISTSSPRNIFDFNVYIYDLVGSEKQVISQATHPEWLSNSQIVYKQYTKSDNDKSFYIYNLQTKEKKKIEGVSQGAFLPEVSPEKTKLIYENFPQKEIWVYDLDKKTNSKILDKARAGFWLSKNKIFFIETEPCSGDEDCGMVDYKDQSAVIYDLDQNKRLETVINLKEPFAHDFSSLYK